MVGIAWFIYKDRQNTTLWCSYKLDGSVIIKTMSLVKDHFLDYFGYRLLSPMIHPSLAHCNIELASEKKVSS